MHIAFDFLRLNCDKPTHYKDDMPYKDKTAPATTPSTCAKAALRRARGKSGFTLVELMVGVTLMLMAFSTISFMGKSTSFTNDSYNILATLEQAQSHAVSRSTYVWVGFFEESPMSPGTQGQGQLVMSVVASADGTNLASQTTDGALPVGSLVQKSRLLKVSNMHITTGLTAVDIPSLLSSSYQIDPTSSSSGGNISFSYPLKGAPQYKFQQIIQFDPHGDASVIYGRPVQVMQLGLVAAAGNKAIASKNVSAIQISGIGGKANLHRP